MDNDGPSSGRSACMWSSGESGRCLDGEGRVLHLSSFLRRQVAVAIFDIERRSRVGEYSGGVAPVEHEIEEDAERRRELSCPAC